MTVTWTILRFDELLPGTVYDMLSLRQRVFIVEQRSLYLDADGRDARAWHLLGRDEEGVLVAYLRLLEPGAKFREPSIGRVVVRPGSRGRGLGKRLMREGIFHAGQLFPGSRIRISAQTGLLKFYEQLGFRPEGKPYDEDGIEHCEMVREP
jgi:ElaA protein